MLSVPVRGLCHIEGAGVGDRVHKTGAFRAKLNLVAQRLSEHSLARVGPGLITGVADDDPSGIATYSQAGAQFGLNMLWTMPLAFPLMAAIQSMCACIGRVTGKGLAAASSRAATTRGSAAANRLSRRGRLGTISSGSWGGRNWRRLLKSRPAPSRRATPVLAPLRALH